MIGIIIAAGLGSRMGKLTVKIPKCMLRISGKPLIHYTINRLKAVGCDTIIVIVGHGKNHVEAGNSVLVSNHKYRSNNILHSLMCAREFLKGDVICTYSDIWVEQDIYFDLIAKEGDIVAAIDIDWLPYYENRTDHPLSEAENAFLDHSGKVLQIGKNLELPANSKLICGEFIGLWRMSDLGTKQFVEHFDRIDHSLNNNMPFQQAEMWQKAYITDMFQGLIDNDITILSAQIKRGWAELDTQEDYARLATIAAKQNLWTITE